MSGFPILDLILGLVFIFFVMSIISSAVVEIILTKFRFRNKILTQWLLTIFDKKIMQPDGTIVKLGHAISDHCVTTALAKSGQSTSFIDAKNFVSALIEKLSYDPDNPRASVFANLDELLKHIESRKAVDGSSLLSTELTRTILIFGAEAKLLAPPSLAAVGNNVPQTELPNQLPPPDPKNSLQIFREKLEHWFDSNMDRISGSLKAKYARPITFWVGLITVVLLNVDTLQIASYLYDHKEETKLFADRVEQSAKNIDQLNKDTSGAAPQKVLAIVDSMRATTPKGLPLGWNDAEKKDIFGTAKKHAFGWLATLLAVMLGAPFWFDLLNKIANIRGAGSKPASSTDQQRSMIGSKT
jgi:hypothetical protein